MDRKLCIIIGAICYLLLWTFNCSAGIIDENRIWHYSIDGIERGNNNIMGVRFQMKFDGIENINGQEYHILKTFNTKKYQYNYPLKEWEYVCDINSNSRFYMREDDKKTYIYNPTYGNIYFNDLFPPDYNIPTEYVIYDFGLNVDEGYDTYMGYEKINLNLFKQIYISEHDLCVNIYTDSVVEGTSEPWISAIDGVGFVNDKINCPKGERGSCVAFINFDTISGFFYINESAEWLPLPQYTDLYLKKVTDLDGNTIFEPSMLNQTGKVKSIYECDAYNNHLIYDIYGRIVKYTIPGSIYIKNGKKFIAM